MTTRFKKFNDVPIPIEYPMQIAERRGQPWFKFENRYYYLDQFLRCHDNPWLNVDGIPKYIHGVDLEDFSDYNPIYIEFIGDEYVNVYREIAEE